MKESFLKEVAESSFTQSLTDVPLCLSIHVLLQRSQGSRVWTRERGKRRRQAADRMMHLFTALQALQQH